ncbi:hypothetical protein [Ruania albidiflava]|uniref:hypothetical protein n=1 Tax=Ruania albidiflava TaxID=366586 RepID=UPI0003B75B8B|nr:hypothetical protein [Ruania albidiflava]
MSQQPEQAEQLIRELGSLTDQARTIGRSRITGVPLLGWGIAFGVGYAALDLLDGAARLVVVLLAWAVGMLGSWYPVRHAIRTGSEGRIRWGWVVVLGASPFLVAAAQPSSWIYTALFLGGLWGLAMCLYAVATEDVPFVVASIAVVVLAALAAGQDLAPPLALFGVTTALPLLVLGVRRTLVGSRHV